MIQVTVQEKISEITIEPFTEAERNKIIQESFNDLTAITSENLSIFLEQLKKTLNSYLKEYKQNWDKFNSAFNITSRVSNSTAKNKYDNVKNYIGVKKYAEQFIRTLEKGDIILSQIRTMLTGQTIDTRFMVKSNSGEMYYIDQEQVRYRLALSTYGSSGNNFVSLAYKVDVKSTIKDIISNIDSNNISNINSNDIYLRIMEVKNQYLSALEIKNNRKYIPYFDSKDTEIFDLLTQRINMGEISVINKSLTFQSYVSMRKKMGGGGGYRSSKTQLGDVGLIQDKFVTQKKQQVNFLRQTLVYNRFQELYKSLVSGDSKQIKQTLLRIFTEKQSRVGDSVSKMTNREATQILNQLFK